ncbi:hypothetical protein [Pleionea sp. CnH1-48]|uniref:hypothetical protein n=1 Tax=Pleionea sp. CnH1-48 TaxID=2954494 RepID=UPI002097119F|nr:hypothetical protein [Pleionea sp. CnH1-48]MCO7224505.1 hypothetical protein [Pleionea sp. CnH1-48]
MKKFTALIFVILSIVVFHVIFDGQYEKSERESYQRIRDHCLLHQMSLILNDYYQKKGEYPKPDEWQKIILDNGFAKGLGCGSYGNYPYGNRVINSFSEPFVYVFSSKQKVEIYSDIIYETDKLKYVLEEGQWKRVDIE